ncbi:MAG: diguanylate cyclase/phosphodiesterase, partial [Acidimicrobiales bacterium]|nr:diguanylate cyclase/phosphodiesterase [Acidimicrobiales bacterium]
MSRSSRVAGGARNREPWSVGAHLVVIVVVVVVVFAGVGAVLGHQTWQNGQQNVRANARSLAGVAADTLADNVGVVRTQTASIAANPAVPGLMADATGCSFDFHLEGFPRSHLDIVRPDGTVVCSSTKLAPGRASHAGAAWLHQKPSKDVIGSAPFVDRVTGLPAVAFVATVRDTGGRAIGNVAIVLPTPQMAQPIADFFGGPRHYQFALVDQHAGRLLSTSSGITKLASNARSTNPMRSAGFLYGSRRVAHTDWLVYSGVDPHVALASTRSALQRGALLAVIVLAVLVASIVIVSRKITRPLRALSDAVGSTGPHVDGVLGAIQGPREVSRLAAEFRVATAARDAYESQLSHQALHDPLTGLPNRALLAERLSEAVERATREGVSVAVLFLDLDRFKLVNDSLGHDVGDHVLITTAGRLREVVPPGGTLARFGGDEFVVVAEVPDDAAVSRLADELLAAVDDPIETANDVVRITASLGIAISTPERRPADLIRDADNAMYAAKERGRGRAERYSDLLHDQASVRLTMASEFRVALDRDELHVAYQPKVDLATGEIVGVESLLRWDHPALGSVPPSRFIPIAEETDAIVRVGEFVLEQSCRQAMAWRRDGIDLTVAVNISGRQLASGELPVVVAAALAISGLEPDRLCLELTESLLMSDTIATQRTLDELHSLGVRLSIDDFGT